jgi:hypothetical protein
MNLYSQHQLYADDLGPAEEVENDRQQRVYRGQPSTVGQVARDRDGLRHQVTNAIPVRTCNILLTQINKYQNHNYRGLNELMSTATEAVIKYFTVNTNPCCFVLDIQNKNKSC